MVSPQSSSSEQSWRLIPGFEDHSQLKEYSDIYAARTAEIQPASPTANVQPISTLAADSHTLRVSQSTANFFQSVSSRGFPQRDQKAQPWRRIWKPQLPSPDGKLIVSCPKNCDYGSSAGLGGY